MRIVHISDIHLSKNNYAIFEDDYLPALIKVLKTEDNKKDIDIIAITGDLVDKGGHSLLSMDEFSEFSDPYDIFEKVFISPLKKELELENKNFVFTPGNHDIDENEILWIHEKKLKSIEADGGLNDILKKTRLSSHAEYSHRIKQFKDFEQRFHNYEDSTYNFTRNQSTYIHQYSDEVKVGFALINDSWRCSTCELEAYKEKGLFFGAQQLKDALKLLDGTTMNIVMTHHPISRYGEKEEVKNILTHKKYHMHLYGDQHHHQMEKLISSSGECFSIMARAALNNPKEKVSKWQPGFHFIDIDFREAVIELIKYYRYWEETFSFGVDSEIASPDGIDKKRHSLYFEPVKAENKNIQNTGESELTTDNYLQE